MTPQIVNYWRDDGRTTSRWPAFVMALSANGTVADLLVMTVDPTILNEGAGRPAGSPTSFRMVYAVPVVHKRTRPTPHDWWAPVDLPATVQAALSPMSSPEAPTLTRRLSADVDALMAAAVHAVDELCKIKCYDTAELVKLGSIVSVLKEAIERGNCE